MRILANPFRRDGLPPTADVAGGDVRTDAAAAVALFRRCPAADETPLRALPALAAQLGVASLHAKDERARLGLGSFKALGAAFAIARAASRRVEEGLAATCEGALAGDTFVCASAGNHGLSMAAGARVFGARAVVFLSDTVAEDFAERLREKGARVIREGRDYEASMEAAAVAAERNGWYLLSDSSWPGYTEPARDVMEGYLIMGAEVARQVERPPTHIFLQAGVGGLAAACTAAARTSWGDGPRICIVEPEYAPALMNSIRAGKAVASPGPVSNMGRLDCKRPSHLALRYLAAQADAFMTVSDDEAAQAVTLLRQHDVATSPSGAAGLAGLRCATASSAEFGVERGSRALVYVTEGPEVERT